MYLCTNEIHERSLRTVINDKNSNFEDLLKSSNQVTVHQRNLQILMTEVFKSINSLSPPIIFYILQK